MRDSDKRQLDAYLAGELSPSEQRELAQAALDDPELFELLASAAVVNASAGSAFEVSRRSRSRPVKWLLAGAAVAAAVIAIVTVNFERSQSGREATSVAAAPPTTPATAPPPRPPAAIAQPIILSARLGDAGGPSTPAFRTAIDASREPKVAGTVTVVEGDATTTDLGSLDGVSKGSELPVSRSGQAVGRLTVATVFRERSRGRVASADAVHVGDRVEVPAAIQSRALLERALAQVAAGDRDAAHALARRAATLSASAPVTDGGTMNEIATVLIDNRDYADAEALLRRAQTQAAGIVAVRVANNLGALAALQGNLAASEALYRSALTLPGTGAAFDDARHAIESNLQGLKPR